MMIRRSLDAIAFFALLCCALPFLTFALLVSPSERECVRRMVGR